MIRKLCHLLFVISFVGALAACAGALEPRIDTSGVDETQLRADLRECESIARDAGVRGDLEVPGEDRPVTGGDRPSGSQVADDLDTASRHVITEEEQVRHIIENCMVERGYRLLE